jgi:hypothetical protein
LTPVVSTVGQGKSGKTTLLVNGEPITLNRFAQDIIAGAILGILSALKGVDKDIKTVEVTLRKQAG